MVLINFFINLTINSAVSFNQNFFTNKMSSSQCMHCYHISSVIGWKNSINDCTECHVLCLFQAYYREGVALQCLGRHAEALAAFSSGLAQAGVTKCRTPFINKKEATIRA
jgi:hypothetical protein